MFRKFFAKQKRDAKFKLAGPGHALNEPTPSRSQDRPSSHSQPRPKEMSSAAQTAGAAALSRVQSQQQAATPNWSQTYLKAQIRREMESEQKQQQTLPPKTSPNLDRDTGIYFTCPLIGPEVLPREEIKAKIREFLYEQLEHDRAFTACLIIQTCNQNRSKVSACTDVLTKYLNNVLEHKDDEKYRKIRVNNKVFQEKVACLEGTSDFLLGAGFERKTLEYQGSQEEFWIFPEEKLENNLLQELLDALVIAEPIKPQLDRAVKLLHPQEASRSVDIPQSFYNLTLDELKKEQSSRTEELERNLQLRTKAMRERDEMREVKKFRYCYIRIKFPNSLILQGIFGSYEKFENVKEFVSENLYNPEWQYTLRLADNNLTESTQTLMDLGLPPSSLLNLDFLPDQNIEHQLLKSDVLALLQSV